MAFPIGVAHYLSRTYNLGFAQLNLTGAQLVTWLLLHLASSEVDLVNNENNGI